VAKGGDKTGGRRRYRGALSSHLRDIRRYELLTQSREVEIGQASRRGQKAARNALVEANIRLVVKIASEYRRTQVPREELIAEGEIGLIEAANRFDPAKGVRFVSYAAWWIRKYMFQAVDRHAHQTSSPLASRPAEDAKAPGSPRPRRPRQKIVSFDAFMQTSSDRHILETIASEGSVDPEGVVLERQLARSIRKLLPRLPGNEGRILAAHFGLDGAPPRTLQQIGKGLGLTRERVRQIEIRALARARRLMEKGKTR
jgi:RNA polymerase sigma factor (sigma-70 family)